MPSTPDPEQIAELKKQITDLSQSNDDLKKSMTELSQSTDDLKKSMTELLAKAGAGAAPAARGARGATWSGTSKLAASNSQVPPSSGGLYPARFADQYKQLIDAFIGSDDLFMTKLKDAVTRINAAVSTGISNVLQVQPVAYGFIEMQDTVGSNGVEVDDLNVLQVFLTKVDWTLPYANLRDCARIRQAQGPDWLV